MTVTVKNLVPSKQTENTQTTQYTASNVKAVIDKATVTNTSGSNATLSVNLVTSGDTAGNSNLIIDTQTVLSGETLALYALSGQVIESGGFISTLAGTASALTIRVSGREIS
jgi:hypothetical protein